MGAVKNEDKGPGRDVGLDLRNTAFALVALVPVCLNFGGSFDWLAGSWAEAGDACQAIWTALLQFCNNDPFNVYVYATNLLSFLVYWIFGLMFLSLDVFNWPSWIRKYKVQQGTNEPVEKRKLRSTIGQVLFNQLLVGFPLTVVSYYAKQRNGLRSIDILPSFPVVVRDYIVMCITLEIGFYYSHRLLHFGPFYKYIHKRHHTWTAPIAISAVDCHPLEHGVTNILPWVIGGELMKSHIISFWIFSVGRTLGTLYNHCGYYFPGFRKSVLWHDAHHEHFSKNYGMFGYLDRLHGTGEWPA